MKIRLFISIVLVLGFIGVALPVAGQTAASLGRLPRSVSLMPDKAEPSTALLFPVESATDNQPLSPIFEDYLYNYTFGTGSNTSDQNFVDWGNKASDADCFYGSDGTRCSWGQDLQIGGNSDGSLMMYQNGLYSWAGASPNNLAPTDFEYSADIFVVEPKKNARFGLIFDASTSTFGRDGDGVPLFDPNHNLYKFDLQFDENTETIIRYYRLEACQNSIQTCAQPVAKTVIPTGYIFDVGSWNNIRVQRLDTNLKVYLNNNLLINITDSTHIRSGKYGVFLQTKDFNSSSNPLKIKIDNVRIKASPATTLLSGITITGPTTGTIATPYLFVAASNPITATQPITFVWQATAQPPVTTTGGLSSTAVFTWTQSDTQTITVTAANDGSVVTDTHAIAIAIAAGPLATIAVTPNPISMIVGATQTLTTTGADEFGNAVAASPTWTTDAGTLTGNVLTAQTMPASGRHVTATVGSISGTAIVNVIAGSLNRLTITPTVVTLTMRTTQQFTAAGFDGYNNVITQPALVWQVTPIDVGVIKATGWFTAGNKAGVYPDAIVIASGSISATAKVIVQPHQVYLPVVLR
jgi:hypothetical protein